MTIDLDEDDVPFGAAPSSIQPYEHPSGMIEVEQARAEQEQQAGFLVAKKFPRHEQRAIERIIRSCQRKSLAEQAEYAFPRGGQQITGPSIRLAEVIAQSWGNVAFGIRELQAAEGVSQMLAYCYDLETNTRAERIFNVKHERKAKGRTEKLTDARDVYEMTANQGARRLRACILQVIPGDVVEAAVDACRATLEKEGGPITERISKMLDAFAKLGVTKAMIEKRFEKNSEALLPADLVVLRRIYMGISDGISQVSDWFEKDTAEKLKESLSTAAKAPPKEKPWVKPPKSARQAPAAPVAAPGPEEAPEEVPQPPSVPAASYTTTVSDSAPVGLDAHIVAKATMQAKAGRKSNWQEQYEERFARGVELVRAITGGSDAEAEMAKSIIDLLRPFGAGDIDELEPQHRLKFRQVLDELLVGLEQALSDERAIQENE